MAQDVTTPDDAVIPETPVRGPIHDVGTSRHHHPPPARQHRGPLLLPDAPGSPDGRRERRSRPRRERRAGHGAQRGQGILDPRHDPDHHPRAGNRLLRTVRLRGSDRVDTDVHRLRVPLHPQESSPPVGTNA